MRQKGTVFLIVNGHKLVFIASYISLKFNWDKNKNI